jgi:hypothetical protein
MVVLQRLNGVENRLVVAAIMELIQDEDGDVSIDLAAVVGMQNEIWALYISSVDLPSLGEPYRHSGMLKLLKRNAVSISRLEEVARKDDDIMVQEGSRVDLGIVEDDAPGAVLLS